MNTRFCAVPLALSLLTACGLSRGPAVHAGEAVPFNGATVQTWATLGPDGQVTQVGITLPMTAIQNGPTDGQPVVAEADFPAVVQQTTYLQHLSLDWNPHGHDPAGRYDVPHFDLHLHTSSKAAVAAIDCTDLTQINPAEVPAGWAPPVPPGAPPQTFCVPRMGFHSLPLTEFAAPGQLQPGFFDKVMIAGSYAGKFIFLEPMVTQAFLLTRQSFTLPVPMPRALGRPTRYPTTFTGTYNTAQDAYQFVLGQFTAVQ